MDFLTASRDMVGLGATCSFQLFSDLQFTNHPVIEPVQSVTLTAS
jgi:hypothetical protein